MTTTTRVLGSALVCLLMALGLTSPVSARQTATSGAEAVAGYDNCTALNRDYRHGVSDRRMSRQQWIRKGATGKGAYKPNLYDRVHSNLDRDDDHIACEK